SHAACAQPSIKAVEYAGKINEGDARKHLTILASDEFEGRDTGKPGGEKAARYIAEEFKKLNLIAPVSDTYYQPVDLEENKFEVQNYTINGKKYESGKNFFMTGAGEEKTISGEEILF